MLLYFFFYFLKKKKKKIFAIFPKNFKFFKNIVFFSTSLMIYLLGNFSGRILKFLGLINVDLSLFLILANVIIGLLLGL